MANRASGSNLLWGQDVPYDPNNLKVQQYEQDQKRKTQRKKIQLLNPTVGAMNPNHQRAINANARFVNWNLAKRMHSGGMPKLFGPAGRH